MAKITEELRESMIPCISDGWLTITKSAFECVADRIDAEYEKAVRELNDYASDSVLLPRDADGVPIHIGDEMECGDGTVFTVESISLHPFGWRCDGDGIDGNGYKCTAHPLPHSCRHHHAPTVEDVLRQVIACANNGTHVHGALDTEQIVAEYAAKLRAIIEGSKGPEWQETDSQDEGR